MTELTRIACILAVTVAMLVVQRLVLWQHRRRKRRIEMRRMKAERSAVARRQSWRDLRWDIAETEARRNKKGITVIVKNPALKTVWE